MQNKPALEKSFSTEAAEPKPHKLAQEFSVFINGSFDDDGIMDLTNMDENGRLTGGKHHHGTAHDTINGQATKIITPLGGSSFALSLQKDDNTAFYNGLLVVDENNKLVVVGGYCLKDPDDGRPKVALAAAQDEGVWVITKP